MAAWTFKLSDHVDAPSRFENGAVNYQKHANAQYGADDQQLRHAFHSRWIFPAQSKKSLFKLMRHCAGKNLKRQPQDCASLRKSVQNFFAWSRKK